MQSGKSEKCLQIQFRDSARIVQNGESLNWQSRQLANNMAKASAYWREPQLDSELDPRFDLLVSYRCPKMKTENYLYARFILQLIAFLKKGRNCKHNRKLNIEGA